ncbi:succinate dehydrogenase assembly factor 4, mitochondrial-like [Bombyx mandarina]|uniref:Succinate dehydrogenase assembly factor 4, mitochondrial n=1 Tax=Bombyx mandarina TaxID=7092 RepID=A0A6J2K514_BOMMA|nr:succinate dehydrogenase assembly factor 4, mitochondrial-like [Bombyx mandarina]
MLWNAIRKLRNKALKLNNARICLSHYYSQQSPIEKENESVKKPESKRLSEFRKKLRETTSITDLGEQTSNSKEDALPPWPNNTNPNTGEVGGPKGPEPTRYGDWERKGRVSDF